jgi:hypothetical protein
MDRLSIIERVSDDSERSAARRAHFSPSVRRWLSKPPLIFRRPRECVRGIAGGVPQALARRAWMSCALIGAMVGTCLSASVRKSGSRTQQLAHLSVLPNQLTIIHSALGYQLSRLLKKGSASSFRGAPKARTRNPETREINVFLDTGSPLRGVRNDRGEFFSSC